MKKIFSILLTITLLIAMVGTVSAATSKVPTFKVDGKLLVTPSGEPQPYINKDNRTMGSLRLIAAAVGVENKYIKWDQAKQTATLTRGSNTVSVTVGKKVITVNGKSVTMDTVAEMKQGRVFIPARFIAQGLGVKISFESSTNTVNFLTGAEVVNNNFADYGLTQKVDLPVTLAANGLEITYHEAFLYKATSTEAKEIQKRFEITSYYRGTDILLLKVTMKNTSNKVIQHSYDDVERKIRVSFNTNAEMTSAISTNANLDKKDGDFLNVFLLQPQNSLTGYVVFIKKHNHKDLPIDYINFMTVHREKSNINNIAKKE